SANPFYCPHSVLATIIAIGPLALSSKPGKTAASSSSHGWTLRPDDGHRFVRRRRAGAGSLKSWRREGDRLPGVPASRSLTAVDSFGNLVAGAFRILR